MKNLVLSGLLAAAPLLSMAQDAPVDSTEAEQVPYVCNRVSLDDQNEVTLYEVSMGEFGAIDSLDALILIYIKDEEKLIARGVSYVKTKDRVRYSSTFPELTGEFLNITYSLKEEDVIYFTMTEDVEGLKRKEG